MKFRALAFALTVGVSAPVLADIPPGPPPSNTPAVPPAKEKLVRKLLTLTKAGDIGVQMSEQIFGQLKPMLPQVPQAFWTDFAKEINSEELISKIVPIYAKHLSEEDLTQLIKFYESPVGKKLIAVQPAIMQESVAVGQIWGRALAERVMKRLKEKKLVDDKK